MSRDERRPSVGEQIVARLKQFVSALQRRNMDEYRITKIVRSRASKGEWCAACNRDADDSAGWLRFTRNDGSIPFTLCPQCQAAFNASPAH